jgi:HAD superfamily hydrolase (TIGR01484 family)
MGGALTPIAEIGAGVAATVHTLITDVDDTLTTDGLLTAAAYTSLEQLHRAGLRVIVTTGRPAGWCDHIARMWPVDAVVGENGAVCFWYDRSKRKLFTRHSFSGERLRANRERISAVAEEVLQNVPGTALASDQFCRLYDLAIDYCEDVPRIGDQGVNTIVRIMQAAGMTAKISSIHVNGWFGAHDKLSTSKALMQDLYGVDLDGDRAHFIYVGDSPNDAPCSALPVSWLPTSATSPEMEVPSACDDGRSGEGFSELASLLIATRRPAAA